MAQTSLIVHRPGDRGPVDDLAREKAERRRDTLRGERQPRQARAGRVGDGIGDGGGRRADGRLADAACAEGAEPFAGLDDDGLHVGDVGSARDEVRGEGGGEVDAVLHDYFFHEPVAEIGRDTSELQSLAYLVCRLLLEKKKKTTEYT